MMHFLIVLCALFSILLTVNAQLPPLPDLPTIPPITIPPLPLPVLPLGPVVPAVVRCPAGFFTLLAGCAPCSTGTTSIAGGLCTLCPVGFYSPGPGEAQCYACPSGYTTSAHEACADAPPKKGKAGKRE